MEELEAAKLATIPAPINDVRLAFLQGSPLALVGWGVQDEAGVKTDCQTLRNHGATITAWVGGQGGAVDIRSHDRFVSGVGSLHAKIGIDRLDWDVEASTLTATDVLAIAQTLHDRSGIMATMAPNGSNVDTYLPVAVELFKRGLLAAYGQQFYDAQVPLGTPDSNRTGTAMGRIAQAVKAGLPPSVIQVGMMVGPDSRHWTIDTA